VLCYKPLSVMNLPHVSRLEHSPALIHILLQVRSRVGLFAGRRTWLVGSFCRPPANRRCRGPAREVWCFGRVSRVFDAASAGRA
jgi:hypothetical protein